LKDNKLNLTEISTPPERALERTCIHRDYLAHSIRYSTVFRRVKRGMNIIDIGCGRGYILKGLYSNKLKPNLYLGVDIRRKALENLEKFKTNFRVETLQMDIRTDCYLEQYSNLFDLAICFEVIEHFEAKYLDYVLRQIKRVLKPGGILMLSTPNFNGKAAKNHIHEYTAQELRPYLLRYFRIENTYGIYASQREIEPELSISEHFIYQQLKEHFDTDILSLIFAPLHPYQSRNILWILKKE